jgi:hypothetical protein
MLEKKRKFDRYTVCRFPLGIALGCAPEKEEDKQFT